MISVEEAKAKILSAFGVLDAEAKPLLDSLNSVLAEDIYASFDVPAFDNSAMDGYAVRYESIKGASSDRPGILRLIDTVAAGSVSHTVVGRGTAIRIMTGAPVPEGADSVVPFELTDEAERKSKVLPAEIGILHEVSPGDNIRHKGEDLHQGDLIFKKGTMLHSAEIGVLASLGRKTVNVIRRPVIAILATGDELLDFDQPLTPGKLYNSNSYSLAAQVLECGAVPKLLGIARDNIGHLSEALHRGSDADMIITSGGVSVGDYDKVKEVLSAEGDISFWTVRMKPGKPIAFGMLNRKDGKKLPHLGLPGNPVSSMVTFELFARPALFKMMGRSDVDRPVIKAVLKDSLVNSDGRRIFARVVVTREGDAYSAHLTGGQGSGILVSMVHANGLAIVPENIAVMQPGSLVEVMLFDRENA